MAVSGPGASNVYVNEGVFLETDTSSSGCYRYFQQIVLAVFNCFKSIFCCCLVQQVEIESPIEAAQPTTASDPLLQRVKRIMDTIRSEVPALPIHAYFNIETPNKNLHEFSRELRNFSFSYDVHNYLNSIAYICDFPRNFSCDTEALLRRVNHVQSVDPVMIWLENFDQSNLNPKLQARFFLRDFTSWTIIKPYRDSHPTSVDFISSSRTTELFLNEFFSDIQEGWVESFYIGSALSQLSEKLALWIPHGKFIHFDLANRELRVPCHIQNPLNHLRDSDRNGIENYFDVEYTATASETKLKFRHK